MFDNDFSSETGRYADLNNDGKVDFEEYLNEEDDFERIMGTNDDDDSFSDDEDIDDLELDEITDD